MLRREKQVRGYIYFSSDPGKYRKQKENRRRLSPPTPLPSDAEAVAILVETIRHPHLSVGHLCRRLKKKSYTITPDKIEALFDYHQLRKKKRPLRRPDTPFSLP